jgi:hypothetical protein
MGSPQRHSPRPYRRRRPEQGLLHRILREHLATFLARAEAPDGRGLPRFVRRELMRYLACGVLAFGFARVHCSRCGRDDLVAFACKGRGFCPSCCSRRMADTAAHLVDDVLPRVPVRQWVLSLPHRVRYLLAYNPRLCAAVRRILVRVVLGWQEEQALREGIPGARSGAVVFTQRFGSTLNSNLHFHALGELCCDVDGFSLHAKILVEAHQRERLEQLCRYVTRPPLATERLSLAPDGKVVYRLRRHWRDGTAAIAFDPLTFIERLAALVPRPRCHQLTYHGVLAPAAPWRDLVVPRGRAATPGTTPHPSIQRLPWAELLERVFAIDALTCPYCGGPRRLIALLSDGPVVRKILECLNLPTEPLPLAPARAPPEPAFAW